GQDWQTHLDRNSDGRAVGATPQELAAKEGEFDAKFNEARAAEAQANMDADVAAQAKAAAAQDVIASFAPWKNAMFAEDQRRAKAWDAAIKTYQQRFDSYQRQIGMLDDAIARAKGRELTSQLVERLQGQREEGAALMRQLARDAQEDYFRRRMQEAMFEKRLT